MKYDQLTKGLLLDLVPRNLKPKSRSNFMVKYIPTGTYSGANAGSCTTCEAGYKCPGAANRTSCGQGKYSLTGSSLCSDCPIGHKCPNSENGSPTPCSEGSYQSSVGQSSCSACDAGSFT